MLHSRLSRIILLSTIALAACDRTAKIEEKIVPAEPLGKDTRFLLQVATDNSELERLTPKLEKALQKTIPEKNLATGDAAGTLQIIATLSGFQKGDPRSRAMRVDGEANLKLNVRILDPRSEKILADFTVVSNSENVQSIPFGGTDLSLPEKMEKAVVSNAAQGVADYLEKKL
jgi:hypothetical protein